MYPSGLGRDDVDAEAHRVLAEDDVEDHHEGEAEGEADDAEV